MANELPLFYRTPQVLRFEEHKDLVLSQAPDFRFAAEANAIPLTVGEFMPVVRNYPIVFVSSGDTVSTVAITGLKQGQNLFVSPDGTWAEGAYIPAYLRRYPFIFVEEQGADRRVLAVDTASERIKQASETENGAPLFTEDGKAGEGAEPALQLCEALRLQFAKDVALLKALVDQDLLVERHADMEFPDKSRYRLSGMRLVDPERYRALPAETLAEWHTAGWTDAIALHIASQANWSLLLDRNQKNAGSQAA